MLFRSILYSILIHAAVAGLLLLSFDFPARTIEPPKPESSIINAVAVDEKQVQEELDRIKEQEEQERREEEQRRQELEKIEQQRRTEEERLAELKEQKQQEAREREQEQQRLEELEEKRKREAEQERKRLEEERRRAEEEKKRIEAEKRRAEEEKRRIEEENRKAEEERRKAEEERKRREAEEAMKEQLAEEQRREEEAQARADQRVINEYGNRIKEVIRRQFNTSGLPEGLSCVLQIRTIPGGDVVDVRVVSSSGNSIFDRRAETAVHRASPLPVPDNMRVFEKMREIRLTFAPER